MEYNKDDIITLNNNEKYVVIDKINIDNTNYLFLINEEINNDNVVIAKEVIKDNIIFIDNIDSDLEYDMVMKHLAIAHKDEIIALLN